MWVLVGCSSCSGVKSAGVPGKLPKDGFLWLGEWLMPHPACGGSLTFVLPERVDSPVVLTLCGSSGWKTAVSGKGTLLVRKKDTYQHRKWKPVKLHCG